MPNSRAGILAVLTAVLLSACTDLGPPPDEPPSPSAAAPVAAEPGPPPQSFTLVAAGDVRLHQGRSLTAGALQDDGRYDFSGVLAPVAPLISAADLAICHLETPVAPPGGPYRGYPRFAVQPEIVDALAGAGYDLCSTASNHALDDGTDGLVRTLVALDAAGIAHTGTYRTEAESAEPRIVAAGGIRVGHVAGTSGLNGASPPAGHEWSVEVDAVPDVDGAGCRRHAHGPPARRSWWPACTAASSTGRTRRRTR